MSLGWTLALLATSAAGIGYCIWYERRPRELGHVRLFPSTMVMAAAVLLAIVSLAHVISLLTGVPLKGRMGF